MVHQNGASNSSSYSYLKTFLVDNSSDEEKEHSREFKFTEDRTVEDDPFPKHPSKRKREHLSSGSGSDTEVPLRQYSRGSSNRSSRNNSEKSGKVCGTYGSKAGTWTRPRFPSDDSFKSGGEEVAAKSPDITSSSRSNSEKGFYSWNRVDNPEPNESGEEREVTPTIPEKSESIKPLPELRVRSERSAATKAYSLIKQFAPRVKKRSRSRSEGETDDFSDSSFEGSVPRYVPDTALLSTLPQNLQAGYRFYTQLRNDTVLKMDLGPFLDPVDSSLEETKDYYTKIEKPMCFSRIEEKMSNLDYFSTPEIVADLRLIFENCYKYNGTDAWISRLACKIEMTMEQRLTMLPYSLRGKCALAETSPHLTLYRDICGRRTRTPRMYTGCNKSPIMLAMEELTLYRHKEVEIMKEQKSARKEAKLQENVVLLASLVESNPAFHRICNSWEFISSCVMVCVCQEAFDLSFTVADLELGLMYPQHSKYLGDLMIKLCSSGKRLKELEKQTTVSYEEWGREMRGRVQWLYSWVKRIGKRRASTKFGITDEMYNVFGSRLELNPLLDSLPPIAGSVSSEDDEEDLVKGKLFHELSIAQRITLLHCLCTSKVTASPRLQNCFLEYEPESLRPSWLGCDASGNKLFHFPLFPEEVRVYAELVPPSNVPLSCPGEVRCIARNCDELKTLIDELRESGQLAEKATKQKSRPSKQRKLQHSSVVDLIEKLEILFCTLSDHQIHHQLVKSTVFKRMAQALFEEESLAPVEAPGTPARPATPDCASASASAAMCPSRKEEEEFDTDGSQSEDDMMPAPFLDNGAIQQEENPEEEEEEEEKNPEEERIEEGRIEQERIEEERIEEERIGEGRIEEERIEEERIEEERIEEERIGEERIEEERIEEGDGPMEEEEDCQMKVECGDKEEGMVDEEERSYE